MKTHTYTALIQWAVTGAVVPYIRRAGKARDTQAKQWPAAVRGYLLLDDPKQPHRSEIPREDFDQLSANGQEMIKVRAPLPIQRIVTFTVPAPLPPTPQYLVDAEKELDAFGHLNWTVGNEDWIACFDAIRAKDKIVYEVVVDCESGGFVDTTEAGTIDVKDAASLLSYPSYYADLCAEHYIDSRKRAHRVKARETADTAKRWQAHIEDLTGRKY